MQLQMRQAIIVTILSLFSIALYSNTLGAWFVFDDNFAVVLPRLMVGIIVAYGRPQFAQLEDLEFVLKAPLYT
jgi:hypothetical protein